MNTTAIGGGLSRRKSALVVVASVVLGALALNYEFFFPASLVKLAVLGILGGTFALLVLCSPKIGLYTAVFYVYANLTYVIGIHAAYPIVVLVAVATAVAFVRGNPLQLRDPLFNWAIALFSVLVVQSLLFAHDVGAYMMAFSTYVKVLLLTYLIVQLVRTPRDFETYAFAILAGNLAAIAVGFAQIVLGTAQDVAYIGEIKAIRFSGTHPNANNAAAYFLSALPIGIYGLKRYRSVPHRVFFGLASIATIVAVFLTFSRAAFLPLILIGVLTLAREARSAKVYVMTLFSAVVALMFTPAFYWYRLLNVKELISQEAVSDWSFFLRLQAARAAWRLCKEFPLTGVGLGNFDARSGTMLPHGGIGTHNMYLEIFVGLGLFGFTALMLVHVAATRAFLTAIRAPWSKEDRWLSHLSFYLFVGYVSALVSALFQSIQFYYVIWVPLAGGLVAQNLARRARAAAAPGR